MASFTGSDELDIYKGAGEADSIDGRGGSDFLKGGAGNDVIVGGTGNDRLTGEEGSDTLAGGPGFDTINYEKNEGYIVANLIDGTVQEFVTGGATPNWVDSVTGVEAIEATDGNDTIITGLRNNRIDGNLGSDIISAGAGNDTIFAGGGGGSIEGEAGNDVIYDITRGGTGNLLVDGDGERDTFYSLIAEDTTLTVITDYEAANGEQVFIRLEDGLDPNQLQVGSTSGIFRGGFTVYHPDVGEAEASFVWTEGVTIYGASRFSQIDIVVTNEAGDVTYNVL